MKKVNFLAAIVTIVVLAFATITYVPKHNFQYSFSVISDTHLGVDETKYSSKVAIAKTTIALNCIKNCFPKDKCIVINGDVVDNYYETSYNSLTSTILNVNSSEKSLPYIYFNLGNHEFKSNGNGPSIEKYYYRSISQFVNKTHYIQTKLNAAADVSHFCRDKSKSYDLQYVQHTPFFFLGSDSITEASTNDCAYLKPDQLSYLNHHINRGLSFVFCHQPPYNTVKGSDASNCISNTNDLLNVLSNHPKAIIFTAHTHMAFENYPLTFGNNYSKLGSCPVITSPSVYRSLEGLHISVYNDLVYIQGIKYCSNISYTTYPGWSITILRNGNTSSH